MLFSKRLLNTDKKENKLNRFKYSTNASIKYIDLVQFSTCFIIRCLIETSIALLDPIPLFTTSSINVLIEDSPSD